MSRFMHCLNVVSFSHSYIYFNFIYVDELMFSDIAKHCVPKCFLEEWCILHVLHQSDPKKKVLLAFHSNTQTQKTAPKC